MPSWQQGALNVAKFNGRTRALVAVLDGLGAILGAIFIGLLLDKLPYGRRTRGYIGVGTIFMMGLLVWGGGLAFQLGVSSIPIGESIAILSMLIRPMRLVHSKHALAQLGLVRQGLCRTYHFVHVVLYHG
jgi:predicted MFS family arabinose efflux permease